MLAGQTKTLLGKTFLKLGNTFLKQILTESSAFFFESLGISYSNKGRLSRSHLAPFFRLVRSQIGCPFTLLWEPSWNLTPSPFKRGHIACSFSSVRIARELLSYRECLAPARAWSSNKARTKGACPHSLNISCSSSSLSSYLCVVEQFLLLSPIDKQVKNIEFSFGRAENHSSSFARSLRKKDCGLGLVGSATGFYSYLLRNRVGQQPFSRITLHRKRIRLHPYLPLLSQLL